MQIAAVTVNPATAAANEKEDGDDGDSDGTQYVVSEVSEDEEVVYEEPAKETTKGPVEPAGGFEWYQLTDADKDRFQNMVTRVASRAAAHLIMLAI